MRPDRFLAICLVLFGTGWTTGLLIVTAFPVVPMWAAFPLGTALAFKLVIRAGKP